MTAVMKQQQQRPENPSEAAGSAASVANYFAWLVVIDPRDPEAVARLGAVLIAHDYVAGDRTEDLQAILCELLPKPPRPDEPQNRYAVVLDSHGDEWLRDRNGLWCQVNPVYGTRIHHWDDITAVDVLSEGVTS